jgi:hypothetical protein
MFSALPLSAGACVPHKKLNLVLVVDAQTAASNLAVKIECLSLVPYFQPFGFFESCYS